MKNRKRLECIILVYGMEFYCVESLFYSFLKFIIKGLCIVIEYFIKNCCLDLKLYKIIFSIIMFL